jgi:hypothetical protein
LKYLTLSSGLISEVILWTLNPCPVRKISNQGNNLSKLEITIDDLISDVDIFKSSTNPFALELDNPKRSYIIHYSVGEPQIGSRVPVHGTFMYWFFIIREPIRRNTRTK